MIDPPARRLAAESRLVDRDLMARVRAGDVEALRALYDRHAGLVHGLAHRVVDDPAEAGALVQEVFLHVWRHADSFDGERGYFTGWLVSLARNRAIERARTRERKDGDHGAGRPAAAQGADPGESAHAAGLRDAVTRALGTLPDTQRAPLELAYFGGGSHAEIAERLEVPPVTVKVRIRQGMLRLRELLGDFVDAGIDPAAGAENR